MQFAQAYHLATGQPLAFFQADVQWNTQWKVPLEDLAKSLRSTGINFDVFYTGDPATTSSGWVQVAMERIAAVESDPLLQPDAGVVATWTDYPVAALPDNDPSTLTYLELEYTNVAPLFRNGTLSPLFNDAPLTSAPKVVSADLATSTPILGIALSLDSSTSTNTNVALTLTDETGLLYATGSGAITGNGTTSLTLSGSVTQVNGSLNTLLYVGRTPGTDLVQVTGFDGAGAPSQQTVTLQVGEALGKVTAIGLEVPASMTFISSADTGTVLRGTGVPDLFDLTADSSAETQISLFDPRQDIIQISTSMIPDFATLTHDTTATSGGSLISLDSSHSVLVVGTAPVSLRAGNFAFV
jgi:hypothetical protein